MNWQLKQLAEQLEELANSRWEDLPVVKFREALVAELAKEGVPIQIAMAIAAQMDIQISEFDGNNQYWISIIKSFTKIIVKMRTLYGSQQVEKMAHKLSIKYEV